MRNIFAYIASLPLALLAFGCEDVVSVDPGKARPQLVVDAFIDNQVREQSIRLTVTKPYFSTAPAPVVTGATVTVTDERTGQVYTFTDPDNNGTYTWTPASAQEVFKGRDRGADRNADGLYGRTHRLSVRASVSGVAENMEFEAFTSFERVPQIDSIGLKTRKESFVVPVETVVADLWAKDFVGAGDAYYIKAYKNGRLLNKASEITVAYDFTTNRSEAGANAIMPTYFIPPVREGINPRLDEKEVEDKKPLYAVGDDIYCELHAITEETFSFLSQTKNQMTNGGLFAEPIANVPTNIRPVNAAAKGNAIGIFSGSSVSTAARKISSQPAYE